MEAVQLACASSLERIHGKREEERNITILIHIHIIHIHIIVTLTPAHKINMQQSPKAARGRLRMHPTLVDQTIFCKLMFAMQQSCEIHSLAVSGESGARL